jgi:uncharacterized protein YndB with AHSA1/START domain
VTREYANEIELHADREAVWRALTDDEEMSRWLVEPATGEPREGGAYRVSFDDGLELQSQIEAWDPARRLRLATELPLPGEGPTIQEYTFEDRGSVTRVRVVTSGIPDSVDLGRFPRGWAQGLGALAALFAALSRPCAPHRAARVRHRFANVRCLDAHDWTDWPRVGAGETRPESSAGFRFDPADCGP